MKKTHAILTLLSLLLTCTMLFQFTACAKAVTPPQAGTTAPANEEDQAPAEIQAANMMQSFEAGEVDGKTPDQAFIDAQMNFALSLFQGSAEKSGDKNMLISPLSVMLALAMTANGADGETRAEMEALLGGSLTLEELNAYLYGYVQALPCDEKYKVSIANSIWFREDEEAITVEKDFLQTNADYYGAAAYKAPFDDQTVKDINNWVDQNTDGMIKKIVDEIDPSTVMYLINALVFDAEWGLPYCEDDVWDGTFHAIKGEERTVEMMRSEEDIYLDDGSATGFIKRYTGGKYSFVALLPNEGMDLYDYINALTAETLSATLSNAQDAPVIATMPKFSYDYELEMVELLSDMGMASAFGSVADFSKMGQSAYGNLFIGSVLHKTFITVDERGTKAGAVTSVEVNEESGPPTEIYTVTLDRPFVYLIIDEQTDLPIFMGAVTDISK